MKNVQHLLNEAAELLNELDSYESGKKRLVHSVSRLDREYMGKKYGYLQYKEKLGQVLRGKTKHEWIEYYTAYKLSILKRIDYLLSQAFSAAYQADEHKKIQLHTLLPVYKQKFELPQFKAELAEKGLELIPEKAEMSMPKTILPKFSSPKFTLQKFSLSKFSFPKLSMPKIPLPKFSLPKLSMPKSTSKKQEIVKIQVPKPITIKTQLPKPEESAKEKPLKPSKAIGFRLTYTPLLAKALASKLNKLKNYFSAKKQYPEEIQIGKQKEALIEARKIEPVPRPAGEGLKLFARLPKISIFKKSEKPGQPEVREISPIDRLRAAFRKPAPSAAQLILAKKDQLLARPLRKEKGVILGWNIGAGMLRGVTQRFSKKPEPVLAQQTAIPAHVRKLRKKQLQIYAAEKERVYGKPTLLEEQARRVRRILEAEAPEAYRTTLIGQLANLTVKKYSLSLINTFPEIFGMLYNNLRAANVRILSNTYVNIMVLATISSAIIAGMLSIFSLFVLNFELYKVVLYSVLYSGLAGSLSVLFFLFYPSARIRARSRNITTNLPFALNHLSSVAASGVAPSKMFELIAESGEYGEVSIEMKKISNYVNIFGYDLLTAITSVAATTPSLPFKEFLQGFVSTVETGGDLNSFLTQKSEESALRYQLERQKYNESISTYSDIYTGVLIAAPLFFIAALALVNLLGGTIGGLGVGALMAFGAYLVIPLLNILFIIFLQVNQPEV